MATDLKRTPPDELAPNQQYDLFTSFFGDSKDLSNTIELWDSIPKYAVTARQQNALRDDNGRLPPHVAEFEYASATLDRPVRCRMTIKPALIEVEDGVFKDFYPSQTEEIIEEVLKKIFNNQQYGMHSVRDVESWVLWTLYMVRKELRKRGHTRSLNEIKRSIEIMRNAIVDVEMEGRGRGLVYGNPILTNVTRTTRADIEDDPAAKWTAQLPALISHSINGLGYRQFNYALHMRLKTQLARWLHKRLVHRYRNASIITAYTFAYSSIERDSGLLNNKRISANVKALTDALNELESEKVLSSIEVEKRFDGKRLVDAIFKVYATNDFTREVKAASARLNDSQAQIDGKKR